MTRQVAHAAPWRRLALAAAVFAVPLVAHVLWRRSYYGAWLPHTWTVKAHGTALRSTVGNAYVLAWVEAIGLLYLIPLVVLLRPRHLLLLVPAAGALYYAWWVGGDFMAYGRLLVPVTVMVAAVVGWLLVDAGMLLSFRAPRPVAQAAPLVLALGMCAGLAVVTHGRVVADRAKPRGWLGGRWEGVTTMDRFARVRVAAGTWMREHLEPDTLVTVGAAGALPYASGLPTIDAFGLNDPNVASLPDVRPRTDARARPGHQLWAPVAYIKSRDPDLLCHVGHSGAKPPRRVSRGFGRGYAWACIEPAQLAPYAAEIGLHEVGYYCCRRPRGRVVGPFGRESDP